MNAFLDRDTAGQERFAPIGSMYYHGAKAVIFTYDITQVQNLCINSSATGVNRAFIFTHDITQKRTFDSLPRWRQKFEERNEG